MPRHAIVCVRLLLPTLLCCMTARAAGLGALGEQAHAPGEYLEIDAMAVQTRRAALLFHRLTR